MKGNFNVIKKHRFSCVVIFFIVFLISAWSLNFYQYYRQTEGYLKSPISYVKSETDYTYTVGCPDIGSFVGNYALSNNEDVVLLIWPNLFMWGTHTYGVRIFNEDENCKWGFYVNEKLEYISSENNELDESRVEKCKQLLNEHLKELKCMQEIAKKEWDL